MNWLAHVLLSEPDAESRVGQVLADWVKGDARAQFAPGIQRGFAAHRAIDRFTDSHPIVLRSQARIESPFMRYSAVLIDVFYDHILSLQWSTYCPRPKRAFLDEVYAQFRALGSELPERVRGGFLRMADDDWLGSYGTLEGVAAILTRMSRRLSRANGLGEGASQLLAHRDALSEDFREYFPLLQDHVARWHAERLGGTLPPSPSAR